MKFIDADKLIAEIERQKDFYHERGQGSDNAIEEELDDLLSFIDSLQQEQPMPSCKSCGFYENNCPFIRGKFIPYPSKVCKDYTYSVMKEQPEVDLKMKDDLAVIRLWFDTIRNYAVTKRNANGILLSDTRMLEIIALSAKDASEYVELLLGGLI